MSELITESAAVEADETQFILDSPYEIAHVLRDLVRSRALATVHSSKGRETLLTPLLAVDVGAGEIIFDLSASESINRTVLEARKLLFVSAQDKVKIRFTTSPARTVTHEGRVAFAVPIPREMLRLQRREYYRLLVPVANPVKCVIPVDDAGSYHYVETRLHDISHGGVALIAQQGSIDLSVGGCYSNCRIALPDTGNVVVTLEVRFRKETTLLNGKSVVRAGCQFVRPSRPALAIVQRYMMNLERARRTRAD
jgi:c-di-GMP-binding flagellar brake protein YcgR